MVAPEKRGQGHVEPESLSEKPEITDESLRKDNRSLKANEARLIWHLTRDNNNLTVVKKCSDARTILPNPDTTVVVNSIAAGTTPSESEILLVNSPGVCGEIIMTHYDGDTAGQKKIPSGCGGLEAKKQQENNNKMTNSLDFYIRNNVLHPDPVIQAILSAFHSSQYTEKPILAVVQDHRSGEILPIAYLWKEKEEDADVTVRLSPQIRNTLTAGLNYNPDILYENGIPIIKEAGIESEGFKEFLRTSRERTRRLKEKYPDLYETSKIQDPSLVILSTNIIPFGTCFPNLGDRPGTAFEVFVPRSRTEGSITMSEEDLLPSLFQIEYPIKQSLENHGIIGKPFASTNTIVVDTEHLSLSRTLAHKLVDQSDAVSSWVSINGHKIITSETTDGVITQIDYFQPNL